MVNPNAYVLGANRSCIRSVTYKPQNYDPVKPLYEL